MLTTEEIAAQKAEDDKKKADEAEKALEERISKVANAAITSQLKRFKPGVDAEALTKILDERDAKKDELAEAKRKEKEQGGSGTAADSPVIAKLQKELTEIRKEAEAVKAKSAEQEKKQQDTEDKATIMKTLEAAGVTETDAARAAMNHLRAEGLVKRTDDGLVGIDKNGDEEDLADTVTEFLKSAAGKRFLPPSEARGGGSPHKRGGGEIKNPKNSKERAGAALRTYRSGSSG